MTLMREIFAEHPESRDIHRNHFQNPHLTRNQKQVGGTARDKHVQLCRGKSNSVHGRFRNDANRVGGSQAFVQAKRTCSRELEVPKVQRRADERPVSLSVCLPASVLSCVRLCLGEESDVMLINPGNSGPKRMTAARRSTGYKAVATDCDIEACA